MKSELEKLKEKQQRRRRKRALHILALSPLIAFVFVAALLLLTRINSVIVRNGTDYATLDVCESFEFAIGDSLFSVDREAAAEKITVECPYVKTAQIRYRFPGDLDITLTPATAVLALRTTSEVLLLDEDFKVLEVVDRLPEHLLSVDGMDVESYQVGYSLDEDLNIQVSIVRELIQQLERYGLSSVTSDIDLTKQYNITVTVHDVITVYLGNSEDFDLKLNMLVKILNENDVTVPAEIRVRNYSEGRYSRLPDPDKPVDSESTDTSQPTDSQGEISS